MGKDRATRVSLDWGDPILTDTLMCASLAMWPLAVPDHVHTHPLFTQYNQIFQNYTHFTPLILNTFTFDLAINTNQLPLLCNQFDVFYILSE